MEDVELSDSIIKVLAKSILAALLKDKVCMRRYGFILDEETFDNPIHRMMLKIGRDYFKKYGRVPNAKAFEAELTQRLSLGRGGHIPDEFFWKEATEILNLKPDREYIADKVDEWMMRKSLIDIAKYAKIQALSPKPSAYEVRKKMRETELMHSGMSKEDLGEFVFKDMEKRDRRSRQADFVPTGIRELDVVMGGGREKGTLGVYMAPTGQGKSAVLITMGVNAARRRFKVAHITLELSQHAVVNRYEAAFTSVTKPEILVMEEKVKRKLRRIAKLVRPADVIVKEFPARGLSIEQLRAWMANLEFWHEFVPDLLIVDYADIMKMEGKAEDRWINQGDLYTEMRGLAMEKKVAIWTGVQGKKGTLSKKKLSIDDIAGAIEKANIADSIIAVCRTEEEKEAHTGRLFVAKNRDGIDEVIIEFKEDFARSIIESTSKPEYVREAGDDEDEIPPPTTGEEEEENVPF